MPLEFYGKKKVVLMAGLKNSRLSQWAEVEANS